MKTKIMFVCHGNICRSPMAEFIMKKLVSNAKMTEKFLIESSATSTEEIWNGLGSPIYPPAAEELKRHNIPFTRRRATLLCKSDYEKYDLFIGMDNANIKNMNRIFGGDAETKIKRLMDFTERAGEVSDPWYSRNFDSVYRDIYDGCVSLFEYLKK